MIKCLPKWPLLLFLTVEKVEAALAAGQLDHSPVHPVQMFFVLVPSVKGLTAEGTLAHLVVRPLVLVVIIKVSGTQTVLATRRAK